MIIQTISGHETFQGADIRVLLFYRKSFKDEDVPVLDAAKDFRSGLSQIGRCDMMLACEANRNHGAWFTARYAVVERSFVKMLIAKKLPGDFIRHNKQVVLYMRETAALRRIRIPFTGHQDATMSCGYLEGNFDIIPFVKFKEMRYEIPPATAKQFQFEDDMSEYFDVRVIEPETTPLTFPKGQEIETVHGEKLRVTINPARRKIITGNN